MAFKLRRQAGGAADTPEALFRDLRNRQVEGLLAHQADILRAYHQESVTASDVALQLPTGSGKTLVGLLVGEWRRRRFGERAVYLSPTKQLVHQVAEQASQKYGIRTHAFTGSQRDYSPAAKSEYTSSETVALTTYSGLFNTNPFFCNPNVIILDDAHAAENYVADFWSLNISWKEHRVAYEAVASLLEPVLPRIIYQRMAAPTEEAWDAQWVDKLPSPSLLQVSDQLTALLDQQVTETDLKYPWSLLRDHLRACHLYLSTRAILIRPVVPPTRSHGPFAAATQRVYMSATLGAGGDLERITGIEEIQRLPIPAGWDKQGIGRRHFLFPERSLTGDEAVGMTLEMMKQTPRSLVLVPDDRTAREWRESIASGTGFRCVSAEEIEQSKRGFVDATGVAAVMANRYDGIDFVGDECRLLVVDELPHAMNLQERFLVSNLTASVLLNDRIQTRIVQAVGRCTRSATDYSAVVILGEKLNAFFLERDRRAYLHPEIQAEVEFGLDQSRGVEAADFLDYLCAFVEHGEEWSAADEQIIAMRGEKSQDELPGTRQLRQSVRHEVRYQYALWRGDYEAAVRECERVLSALSGDEVRGYRAFWNYLAGSAAWLGAQDGIASFDGVARKYFRNAASAAQGIRWLRELTRLGLAGDDGAVDDLRLLTVIEGLEARLESLGTANDRKFEEEVKLILQGLHQKASEPFEDAHRRLGTLLGYAAYNSDSTAAPDPWWLAGDELCLVAEDHSQSEQDHVLGAGKVRQARGHPEWIRENVPLRQGTEIVSYIISPCQRLDADAAAFAGNVCYWNIEDFRAWATRATGIVRQLRTTFPGAGSLDWRTRAAQAYQDGGLGPDSLKGYLRQSPLSGMEKTPGSKA